MLSPYVQRLVSVQAKITAVCLAAGRDPQTVTLVAVSKTQTADRVAEMAHTGQRIFGENYVQEALVKVAALQDLDLDWHFIGVLQSNKTAEVAQSFSWVHSVDRLKIAQRLSQQRPVHLPPLNVCVQVNTSGEPSKAGVSPEAALALCQAITELPRLRLRGLMALPAPAATVIDPAIGFTLLRSIAEQGKSLGLPLTELSMGTSDDLVTAIAEGATLIRIGTALFGARA